jgi:hypothetical protein
MKFHVVAIPVLAAICLASPTLARADRADEEQRRRDRGGDNRGGNRGRDDGRSNRSGPRVRVAVPSRPIINVNVGHRGRYYGPAYYNRWARSYYRWSPIPYAPWGLIAGSIGYGAYSAYGVYGAPYAPYAHYAPHAPGHGYDFGGVRLRLRPRDAQVFVDGHYAGIVDDFDGTFQQLRLEQGGHRLEIRMPGFEDFAMDVHVQPGKTITLHEDLRPRP